MAKSKRAPTLTPTDALDWTGVRTQRVEYEPAAMIFAQGHAATSVMYLENGVVRLSVLSHAGKEAVVAMLEQGHFFGEGCLAGQTQRMATATAMLFVLKHLNPSTVREPPLGQALHRSSVGRTGKQLLVPGLRRREIAAMHAATPSPLAPQSDE